ncbi:G-protein beta WD-40 repeat [Ostreococcus tauri]|uniref:G-protein beta WD-40 repeat n=1 Tax=Ostreococcus tauri TaxID=70448 RepID=A0A090N302_OSTTA|nr:G-protein beta WD-40 repeat [Ostreococcus tauri]CEF97263.1 G-protein beta WD-40 repeat [Ostreococcus tauri]|eukprot:XP_022838581.1 G-protein beta WD-40 repeat [Ostreococcus tauri]
MDANASMEDPDVESDEAFVDLNSAEYEEMADLDEDDEAPMSSDDEEDVTAADDAEDRDECGTETVTPDRDDAELVIDAHAASVFCVAWSSLTDEATVATGGGDDKGYLRRGAASVPLGGHEESVSACAFSGDGGLLATGGLEGRVCVHDGKSGELLRSLDGPGGGIDWLSWHPRGRVVLAGSEDFTAWMWNGDDGALMQVFTGHSERVSCGGFTPDGKQVVTGSYDGSLRVWQPRTGHCEHVFRGHPFHDGPLTCVAFHPTNQGLSITGSEDNTARLVNIGNGKVLAPLAAHTETIEAVGFCDVMPLAATGSIDKLAIIWDTNTCQSRGSLAHDGAVSQLKWIPNTMMLYSSSVDGAVRLWDARSNTCVRDARGHVKGILDFALSPDHARVITASDDCTARVFNFQ